MRVLAVEKLNKLYKDTLLRAVTFTLNAGEGMGVRGCNGCGKTTLLDIIAGLKKQNGGTVSVDATVGYVMQKNGFQEGLSCMDNLRLEAALCGLKGLKANRRIYECIADCQIESFADKKVIKCSEGMRGRLAIAMSLISNPGLLLLDEAFGALDEASRQHIIDLLLKRKNAGMAILMVSHNPKDFGGLCERVLSFPGEEVSRFETACAVES
jgi:ABC-type multidrug transport system ATPase subunit